jgi:hypothetical protein
VIPDARWLEILKASGWQTTALAVAFGVFIILRSQLPALSDWAFLIIVLCFLICASLSVASILSAARRPISRYISKVIERKKWQWKLRALPDDARTLLATAEEKGGENFYCDPRIPAVTSLRDANILYAIYSGESSGLFHLTHDYHTAYIRHRSTFRAELKCSPEDAAEAAAIIKKAGERAGRPSGR